MKRFEPVSGATLAAFTLGAFIIDTAAGSDSAANLENDLVRCAGIVAGDDRLACFDALVAGRKRIPSSSLAPVAPRVQPSGTKEDFGLSTVQKQKAQPEQKQIESITASVGGLGTSSIGRMMLLLDNGESWELDSADPLLAVGNVVTIERGALGSFLLTTPSRRTHHVRRIH